jgi:aminocarboxymuconate-semialdehyde decarboxylase
MTQLYTCGEVSAARKPQLIAPKQDRPLVVDFHCHLVVPEAEALTKPHQPAIPEPTHFYSSPETRKVNLTMLSNIRPQLTSVERRLADMDSVGIDIQVLSPSPGHYCYWAEEELARENARSVNDALCNIASQNDHRMVALGTLPMQSPRLAIEELRRCVLELGMRGVEISTNVEGAEIADPRFEPILAAAEELGAIVFLHPAGFTQGDRLKEFHLNNVIGNPLETTIALSHLIFGGSLDRLPGLKLVLAHGGGTLGSYSGRFDHAYHSRHDCAHCKKQPSDYLKKMYFDTVVFDPLELQQLVRKFGADRILAGTDYPYDMAEPDLIGFIEGSGFSTEDAAAILGLNAAQLLGINPEVAIRKARGQKS